MRKTRLFTPGPTPLIPEAQLAMAGPLIHHRTPEFKEVLELTRKRLQKIFKTRNEILILASSGTGAMEAAMVNLAAPGDHFLAVAAGKFGERWLEIAEAHEIRCTALRKTYGEAAGVEEILQALEEQPATRALLIQGCETSTGTSHDLRAISEAIHKRFPETLLIVDAVTALGSQPLETDQWQLDVVISGSQKSFGVPPGLAFLSISERARRLLEAQPRRRAYYFDLFKELKGQEKGSTAFTPAVALVMALQEATRQILSQGINHVIEETAQMARCTRHGLQALSFELVSSAPANAVTAAFPPEGIEAETLRKDLQNKFGIKVAGGQGELKGRIIRIAHLGYFDILDVFSVLSAIELCLAEQNFSFDQGSAVSAAMKEYGRTVELVSS